MSDLAACLMVSGGENKNVGLLKCNHEEAYYRTLFHINQVVVVDHFQRVIVTSADTKVFVCLMYRFCHSMDFDLKELMM